MNSITNRIKQKLAIRPKIRAFLRSFYLDDYALDTDMYFKLKALETTCDYITKNMSGIPKYPERFDVLKHGLSKVSLNGLYCEFGVFKGDSLMFIKQNTNQEIHAFDSFQGLPETWKSGYEKGFFKLKKAPSFGKGVQVHVGWFDDTIPDFIKNYTDDKIAFLHIDCDLYSSTNTIFKGLEKKIQDGTVIVFDEYFNYPEWEQHEYLAFQEFIKRNNLSYEYLSYNSKGFQVAVKIKNPIS
ncbi:MAG: class I SAM-dependent methyltransferase [Bacteroidia bacterium]